MTDKPVSHHIFCILNHRSDMYITPPFNIMEETFVSFPKLFDKKILEPCMDTNIQIFAQLSKSMYGTNTVKNGTDV